MTNYLRLTDLRSGPTTTETFGTCELCMSTESHTPQYLVFSLGDETREYETGYWSWGDYLERYDVENVADFAQHINSLNLMDFPDEGELSSIVYRYNWPEEFED